MKIAILGAAGRMGRMIAKIALETPGCEIAALCDLPEAAASAGPSPADGVPFTTDWPDGVECVVDFTFHSAVPAHAAEAAERGAAYVLGTTGLSPEEEKAVAEAARKVPVVRSANMSLGVNLAAALVKRAAEVLGPGYDIEITEMHHRHKKDAPSGTALMLARSAAEGRGLTLRDVAVYGRSGITGERPADEIGIHALRGGSVVGDHTVIFAGDVERIEITHKAQGREAFAAGAVRAALWAVGRAPGLYSMRDVLGI